MSGSTRPSSISRSRSIPARCSIGQPAGAGFVGTVRDRAVYAEQREQQLFVTGLSREEAIHYFALDHPLGEICAAFPDDAAMCAARDYCRGLRILRQPIWECLASFITSSMKQVAHIRQMSRAMRERFGDARTIRGITLHTFPSPERLSQVAESELRECALGYRAKNLLGTARAVASGEADLESWRTLPTKNFARGYATLAGRRRRR
jgi:N-glycosylase/DNA lyase